MVLLEYSYKPSVSDVLAVKDILGLLRPQLPIDLVDDVLDYACYWAHTSTTMEKETRAQGRAKEHVFVMRSKPLCVGACEANESTQQQADIPEPRLEFPARRVVWTIESHDQGYSGEAPQTKGTYAYSWTGFDAGAERFHPAKGSESTPYNQWTSSKYLAAWPGQTKHNVCGEPLAHEWPRSAKADAWGPPLDHPDEAHFAVPNPPIWPRKGWSNADMRVQSNVQAKSATTKHIIEWDWTDDIDPESPEAGKELDQKGRGRYTGDGRLVRKLQRGDCVTLWVSKNMWALEWNFADFAESRHTRSSLVG